MPDTGLGPSHQARTSADACCEARRPGEPRGPALHNSDCAPGDSLCHGPRVATSKIAIRDAVLVLVLLLTGAGILHRRRAVRCGGAQGAPEAGRSAITQAHAPPRSARRRRRCPRSTGSPDGPAPSPPAPPPRSRPRLCRPPPEALQRRAAAPRTAGGAAATLTYTTGRVHSAKE